jgi:hypothetical protein
MRAQPNTINRFQLDINKKDWIAKPNFKVDFSDIQVPIISKIDKLKVSAKFGKSISDITYDISAFKSILPKKKLEFGVGAIVQNYAVKCMQMGFAFNLAQTRKGFIVADFE